MASGGQKWSNVPEKVAEEIKAYLLREGGIEVHDIRGATEVWRIKFSDSTFTYYSSGTLYSTGSKDPAVHKAWKFISSRVGPRFEPPTKKFLIGLDETGKGEIIGHTVLVGVLIPSELFSKLEGIVSVADTKRRRSALYWDELFKQVERFKNVGLRFLVEKIPPWHVDRYNLNKIMDVVYQRILSVFARHVDLSQSRIVIDDYGVGSTLERYLRALANTGAEVIKESSADNRFLEARVASVLAKRERERVIETLRNTAEYQISGYTVGTGNAGDKETLSWLQKWKATGKPWPWFVKRSFRTVRELDGLSGRPQKETPPIRDDILSKEFQTEFQNGRLSITSLSVVCPSCGEISKAALLTPDDSDNFVGRCINCRKPIPDLGITLRYYCGYVLPDSNFITGGLLSKDLERSRFFEGFTILLHAIVRGECDTPGGKKELGRLARFAAIGRVLLDDVGEPLKEVSTSFERDEAISKAALEYNAIILTDDKNMKAAAQARKIFCISTRL